MKLTCEISLKEFDFWAGARDIARRFSTEELEEIEVMLEDLYYGTEVTDTMVNDVFMFDAEMLCEWLGLDIDEFIERNVN